jgi:hypothetical protein
MQLLQHVPYLVSEHLKSRGECTKSVYVSHAVRTQGYLTLVDFVAGHEIVDLVWNLSRVKLLIDLKLLVIALVDQVFVLLESTFETGDLDPGIIVDVANAYRIPVSS